DEKLITGISPLSESLSESPEADFITEVSLRDIPVVIESEEPWNLSKERGPLLNLPEVGATPPEPRDTKQYTCSVDGCHKVYTTQNHLKVHLRSHSGIKPFRCLHQNCGKSFATNYSLKAHTRVHTGDRPYGCYRLESTLMLHLRTAHNYGPEEESYQQLGDQEGQDIGGNSSTIELQPPKINEPEQSPSNDTATTFVLQGSTRLFHLLENHEMLRNGMAEVMIVCTN
ncbi:hypothetical protein TCAL_06125, partial [Tigriopus californicus]